MEGRCMKCRESRPFGDDAQVATFGKKGARAMKGKCPKCGTNMFRILPKDFDESQMPANDNAKGSMDEAA